MNAQAFVIAPAAVFDPIDIERVKQNVSYYTNGKVSTVIFKNGSCAFPPLGDGAIARSIALLNALPRGLSFNVREMDDKNFVVEFGEYVFCVVFGDELNRLRDDVTKQIDKSSATEAILGRSGVSRDHLLIGIIARTRLIQDIAEPVIVASIGTKSA